VGEDVYLVFVGAKEIRGLAGPASGIFDCDISSVVPTTDLDDVPRNRGRTKAPSVSFPRDVMPVTVQTPCRQS